MRARRIRSTFTTCSRAYTSGAKLYVVDPRRTGSARWADGWLGLDVGSDIALANAVGREILAAGLENRAFIERATSGFESYAKCVEPYTLEYAEKTTGVPRDRIAELAHVYAGRRARSSAGRSASPNITTPSTTCARLINLALLTGHVGRYGSGVCPLRGQNNVQGGGDMGALPDKYPGGQSVADPAKRAKFEQAWNATLPSEPGWNLTGMFDAMERGELDTLYVVGENPAQSEADQKRANAVLGKLKCLIVQDIFLTKTGELADVVLPAASSWCESEGTVTSSERRVQRVRKALEPPGEAREDSAILYALARRLGHDWGDCRAETIWDECRTALPVARGHELHALGESRRDSVALLRRNASGRKILCTRDCGKIRFAESARRSRRSTTTRRSRRSTPSFRCGLTTGRRLDSFNTGVQSGGYTSPLRRGESLDISPEDAARYGVREGERVRVRSRRGSVTAPVRIDDGLRAGLVFMTPHFNDDVATNVLTIDATDPKSGTAEFKAAAVQIERA